MKISKFLILSIASFLFTCKQNKVEPEPQLYTSVCGTVIDADGGFLQDVSVSFLFDSGTKGGPVLTKTDGYYCLNNLESGNATFTFLKEGYETFTQSATVNINEEPDPVNITMKKKALLALKASQDIIEFNNNDDQKTIFIENTQKEGEISFSIAVSDDSKTWLKVDKSSGTVSNANAFQFTISVDRTGLGEGTKSGTILINGGKNNLRIPVNLTIANKEAPTVSIGKPTGITKTSAEVIGTVLDEGGTRVTERGHIWADFQSPTLTNNKGIIKKGAGGLGSFASIMAGLDAGKKYFVRAYATNSQGTNYSNIEEFTTSLNTTPPSVGINTVSEVAETSAVISAIVSNDGGAALTEMGVVYSTNSTPTLSDNKLTLAANVGTEYKITLSGLNAGVTYFVSAFATNSVGTTLSSPLSFTTKSVETAIELQTGGATEVRENSVTLNASLKKLGGSPVVQHGFVYSRKNANPTIANADKVQLGSKNDEGIFTHSLQNLKKGTLYYVKAYATTQSGNTYYGNAKEVVTKEQGLIVYYPMNQHLKDYSGLGNNASGQVTFSNDRNGNEGLAIEMNSGRFQIQNEEIGRYIGSLSIGFWIRLSSSSFNNNSILFAKGWDNACDNHRYWLGYKVYFDSQSSSLKFFLRGKKEGKGLREFFTADLPILNKNDISDSIQWHFVLISKNNDSFRVYLDGLSLTESNTNIFAYGSYGNSNSNTSDEGRLTFGGLSYPECGNLLPNTLLDDFRIYNYPLSVEEVTDIYQR